jgi:hypothetical protein
MSIEVVDYDPTIISKTEAENMISFIVAAPKATTRKRSCLIISTDYGYWSVADGYDAEWESAGSLNTQGANWSWMLNTSHRYSTISSSSALGDGIVGVQDGWSTDEFIRLASDSAEVSSQASGPSYNCNTTGKVINTSWSWFKSAEDVGNIAQ